MNELEKLKAKAFDAKVYDDRAKAAVEFILKTVLGFSGAIVALFFVALTTKIDPPLTALQSRLALLSIASQAGAIFAVLLYAHVTYKHNIRRSRVLTIGTGDVEHVERYRKGVEILQAVRQAAIVLLLLLFLFGLSFTLAFLLNRIP